MNKSTKITAIVASCVMGLGLSAGAFAHINPAHYRHRIVHHDRQAIRHIKRKQTRVYFNHLNKAIRADMNGNPGRANRIMRHARHKIHHLNRVKHAYHHDIRRAKHALY